MLKRHFCDTWVIYQIMDSLISDWGPRTEQSSRSKTIILKILTGLMQYKEKSVYIPGETLQTEQQRIRVMQCGVVPLCLHFLSRDETDDLSSIAGDHLCTSYITPELEWNRGIMSRLVPSPAKPEVPGTDKRYFINGIVPRDYGSA